MNKILKVMCFILFALFAGINTIYAQGQSPTGLVVDENGQPMIGVQIKIEGTTVGAITDVDGNFTIKAQKGNILLFSYVGYEQQKITYKGEKVLAIKMLPSTEMHPDRNQQPHPIPIGCRFGIPHAEPPQQLALRR